MKINFTRKEMRSLLTIAGIAEEVLGVQARADGLFEMIDKILQAAGEMGMPDLVEYIPEHKTYYFSEEGQHALRYDLYAKVFYLNERRRNEAYSLAERDLRALHTEDELAAMDEDERGEILEELCEKHYEKLTDELLRELEEDEDGLGLEGEEDIGAEEEDEAKLAICPPPGELTNA